MLYLKVMCYTFVALVIFGLFKNYSPVPYWDMWDGALSFYENVQEGKQSQWFAQHNEHRIFLSRLLFWIDFKLFGGSQHFLLIINFILLCLISLLFIRISDDMFPETTDSKLKVKLRYFIIIVIFSWLQRDNIIWAFQSQFFLTFLLPLLAFHSLAKYKLCLKNKYFIIALICGVLSAFSMANGILAMPLLFLMGIYFKLEYSKLGILISCTIAVLAFYFDGYESVPNHGSLKDALLNHPFNFCKYLLTYLGSPFYYFFLKVSFIPPALFGVCLIVVSFIFTYRSFKHPSANSIPMALLVFILFFGGTAFATAGGRSIFGVSQAITSRYLTPQLMAWLTIILLSLYYCRKSHPKICLTALLMIPLTLLPYQVLELRKSRSSELFSKELAALALEMNVKDKERVSVVYPDTERAMTIAEYPKKHNLSIFGHPKFKDINEKTGTELKQFPKDKIPGKINTFTEISSEVYLVRGWIYNDLTNSAPLTVYIVNDKNIIVGYAITGRFSPLQEEVFGKSASHCAFTGYMKGPLLNSKLRLVVGNEQAETEERSVGKFLNRSF